MDPATGYVGGPGNHYYMGDTYGQTISVTADYGVWHGLGVTAGAAYVTSKYTGRFMEAPEDDGEYHGSLQDGTIGLAYMIPWQGFAITPSVGARFPLTDYSTMGHVAIGKHLREFPLGISVGRSLDPLLPRAFLSASYAYSFVEDHHEHSLDQRHYDAGAGYIVSRSVSVGGGLQYVETIDGLDWYEDDLTGEEAWHDHDVAAQSTYLRAGAYASISVRRGFSLRVSYTDTLWGENSHDGRSISIAPTWALHGR